MDDALRFVSEKSISEEHNALFEQIDLIDRALRIVPRDTGQIILSVKTLLEITHGHFKHEEILMEETRYDNFLAHKRDHDYLRNSLIHFLESVEHSVVPVLPDIGINLRSWLEFHVKKFDNAYMEALAKPGQGYRGHAPA